MELSPIVKKIYQKLLKDLRSVGNFESEEKKASIHLKNKHAFAGLHPRKDYLYIEIVSDVPIKSTRIFRTEQISKNRFHNTVKIDTEDDIDSELLSWLKSSYMLMS